MARGFVLVTGSANRIGRAIALTFAKAGFDLLLHFRSSQTAAAEARDEICSLGVECRLIRADLATSDGVAGLVVAAAKVPLVGVVNNASLFFATPLNDADDAQWFELFETNVHAPFRIVQGLAKQLREQRGFVVNITDAHVDRPLLGHSIYGMSKAALVHMTKALALELAPEIRVNAVAPGSMLPPSNDEPFDAEAEKSGIPLARLGSTQSIADAVLFLATAEYATGEVLRIDGGRSL